MTRYQEFLNKWKGGCGSRHCPAPGGDRRTRTVMYRGTHVPCDVLFVGEAPGESENVNGRPFSGPAGQLLDAIADRALAGVEVDGRPVRLGFANLVGCIPREEENPANKAAEPDDDQIECCAPRLVELAALLSPRLVVAVGKYAAERVGEKSRGLKQRIRLAGEPPVVDVVHPAWILRLPFARQGLETQRVVVAIRDAAEQYL